MRSALTLVSAAHAGVALASFLAVRGINRLMDDIRRVPQAVGDFPAGIAEVTQWPLIAAWVAVAASLVALVLSRRPEGEERPSSGGGVWLATLGIVLGAASVVAFRALADYLPYALKPGRLVYMSEVVERLTPATAITALCFVAAAVLAVLTFRSRAAMRMRMATVAVVLSLGVSATLIVTLRDLHTRYDDIAHGRRSINR